MALPMPDLPTDVGPSYLDDDDLRSVVEARRLDAPEALRPAATVFVVDDDAKAEWCMRHVRRLARLDADARAKYEQWVRELTDWFAAETADLDAQRSFFEAHLIRYQKQRREADEKAKSLRLPSGVVKSTRSEAAVDVQDEEVLLRWLDETVPADVLERVGAVKTVRSVLKTGLRRLVAVATEDAEEGERTLSWPQPTYVVDEETGERLWPSDDQIEELNAFAVPGAVVRPAELKITVVPGA